MILYVGSLTRVFWEEFAGFLYPPAWARLALLGLFFAGVEVMDKAPVPPPFTQDSPDLFGRFLWVAVGFVAGAVAASVAVLATDPNGTKIASLEAVAEEYSQRATQAENDLAGVRGELHIAQDRIADMEVEMTARNDVPATSPPAASPSKSHFISAHELFANYQDNEVAADATFSGRLLKVRGEVTEIGKDILGTPYVSLDTETDSIGTVQCMFPSDEGLPQLRKGQLVDIEGTCLGLLMNVIVRECRLLKK